MGAAGVWQRRRSEAVGRDPDNHRLPLRRADGAVCKGLNIYAGRSMGP